jgi:hypothetical protein
LKNSVTTARTALINGVLALLDVTHQGSVYLTYLDAEIDQLTASGCGD